MDLVFSKSVIEPPAPPKPTERWTATLDGWEIEVVMPEAHVSLNGRISMRHPERGHFFFYAPNTTPLPVIDGLESLLRAILGTLRETDVDLRDEYYRRRSSEGAQAS